MDEAVGVSGASDVVETTVVVAVLSGTYSSNIGSSEALRRDSTSGCRSGIRS